MIKKSVFKDQDTMIIGTGGVSRIFESEGVFDELIPDLVHSGLFLALQMNVPLADENPRSRNKNENSANTP